MNFMCIYIYTHRFPYTYGFHMYIHMDFQKSKNIHIDFRKFEACTKKASNWCNASVFSSIHLILKLLLSSLSTIELILYLLFKFIVLDKDGLIDLALVSASSHSLIFYRGDGKGKFSVWE